MIKKKIIIIRACVLICNLCKQKYKASDSYTVRFCYIQLDYFVYKYNHITVAIVRYTRTNCVHTIIHKVSYLVCFVTCQYCDNVLKALVEQSFLLLSSELYSQYSLYTKSL